MNKFDTYVASMLEEAVPNQQGGQGTSGDVVAAMIKLFKETSADTRIADAIERNILKNPKYRTALLAPPDSPKRLAMLRNMLDDATNQFNMANSGNSGNSGNVNSTSDLKPGYFNKTKGLGVERGDFIKHGPTEQAFRDTMFDWRQGNLLKKLGMAGRGIGKFISPTHKGSTGVFA